MGNVIFVELAPNETIEDWWVGLLNHGGNVRFIQRLPTLPALGAQ